MSTRNPMNERYQGDGPAGKTRKSASSAKPKHKAAESVRIGGSKDSKSKSGGLFGGSSTPVKANQTKEEKERERKERRAADREMRLRMTEIVVEHDATYRRGRKLWWVMLGCAVVATAVSFFINSQSVQSPVPGIVSIAFAYVFLIAAIFVDFKMVRPTRKKKEQLASVPLSKSQQKALEADRLRRAQEAAAAREARKKNSRLARFVAKNKKQVAKVDAELEAAQEEADAVIPGKDEADETK